MTGSQKFDQRSWEKVKKKLWFLNRHGLALIISSPQSISQTLRPETKEKLQVPVTAVEQSFNLKVGKKLEKLFSKASELPLTRKADPKHPSRSAWNHVWQLEEENGISAIENGTHV